MQKNVELQKKGKRLIRERERVQGDDDELSVCNGCKGFFLNQNKFIDTKNIVLKKRERLLELDLPNFLN